MSDQGPIYEFQREFRFLSNMWVVPDGIETTDGVAVPTVEHAYMASRFSEGETRDAIHQAPDGIEAKKRANQMIMAGLDRPNWGDRRVEVMTAYVMQKFVCNQELGERLLSTEERLIIEGNTWGDVFWGVSPPYSNNGKNTLGGILMDVRYLLRES